MATKQRAAMVGHHFRIVRSTALFLALITCAERASSQPSGDTARQQLQAVFRKQLGNDHRTAVEAYLHYVGLGYGHEWCAAYVSWCFGQIGRIEPRTPWSPALFPSRKVAWRNGARAQPPALAPGMVWGIYIIAKGRIGHVGFVDSETDGLITTVEGNTGAPDGKGPNGVYRKRRGWRTLKAIANWL